MHFRTFVCIATFAIEMNILLIETYMKIKKFDDNVNYPVNFRNFQKKIGGLNLSPPSFTILLLKHEVDDNIIINAFFVLMATTNKTHIVKCLRLKPF